MWLANDADFSNQNQLWIFEMSQCRSGTIPKNTGDSYAVIRADKILVVYINAPRDQCRKT